MAIQNWVFEKANRTIVRLCEGLAKVSRGGNKTFYTEERPYLTRHYLLRRGQPGADHEASNGLLSVYLHYFHRGDEDWALHNHPWGFSLSLILTNGYLEERWTPNGIKKYTLRPGSINIIRSNDFHRVYLINPKQGAWTLFFAGRRVQDWGFWHPNMHKFVPWKQFTRSRDHAQQSIEN